jgi:tripartite-type tricarboxylate transporter receptor subunit TctC
MSLIRKYLGRAALCLSLLIGTSAQHVSAQTGYPNRPITFVVAFPAGGSSDMTGRVIAAGLSKELGQSVVVDNRPGGATVIASESVARARKDGYTVLLGSTSSLTTAPHLYPNLPFKVSDFQPISMLAVSPWIVAVSTKLPVTNMKELVAYAKERPGQLNYHHLGPGTGAHLFAEMFLAESGIKATPIVYKGETPALNALLADEIQIMPVNISAGLLEQHRAGKIRIIGVADQVRSPAAPEIPTFAETGYPGIHAISWFGLVAPAGVPQEVVDRLSQATEKALRDPDVSSRLLAAGITPQSSTPDVLAKTIAEHSEVWGKLIKQLDIKLQF